MSCYYPVYLNITGRLAVVIGGGPVAERKVAGLLDAGARIRIVSPDVTSVLRGLAETGRLEHRAAPYRTDHLDGAALVFAATNVRAVNAQVAADARDLGVPVTVADAPDEGSFVVPAVVRRGEFCLSISTGGNNPMLASRIAAELGERYGPAFGVFVELLGSVRDTIKEWTVDTMARRSAVAAVLDHEAEVCEHLVAGRTDEALAFALQVAQEAVDSTRQR